MWAPVNPTLARVHQTMDRHVWGSGQHVPSVLHCVSITIGGEGGPHALGMAVAHKQSYPACLCASWSRAHSSKGRGNFQDRIGPGCN